MEIILSERRLEVIRQALQYQKERYQNALSLHPRNEVLLAVVEEVDEVLKIVEQRLQPLPAVQEEYL